MKLYIENVGVIKKASIEINGLTVICGENDTGKSTIGKALFALTKGILGYEEEYQIDFSYNFLNQIRQISRLIDEYIWEDNLTSKQKKAIKKYSIPSALFLRNKALNKDFFVDLKEIIEFLAKEDSIDISAYNQFNFYIKESEEFINQRLDPDEQKRIALEQAFFSEFQSLINHESIIRLSDDNHKSEIISIEFDQKCRINELKYDKEYAFGEITYIENPAVIQFFKLIMSARVSLSPNTKSRETVPLHTKDLSKKLFNSKSNNTNELFNNLQEIISNTLQGDFSYQNDKNDFFLFRNGKEIPSLDLASGIKALGIINILVKSNLIKPNDILILDEPEINLHPEWQNKYAEIICILVKLGVKVIVVTHSPYMVSALNQQVKNVNITNQKFYLAEKKIDSSSFSDQTHNVMGGIIKQFALALEGMN